MTGDENYGKNSKAICFKPFYMKWKVFLPRSDMAGLSDLLRYMDHSKSSSENLFDFNEFDVTHT